MKGVEPAEFVLQVIMLGAMAVGILGLIVNSSSFEGLTNTYDRERLAVDLLQGISAAPCLTTEVGGEAWKGLLEEGKLDSETNKPDFCVSLAGVQWGATVEAGGRSWSFGNPLAQGITRTAPVAIKRAGETVPGLLTVVVAKG